VNKLGRRSVASTAPALGQTFRGGLTVSDSTARRAVELCRAIEDSFDRWRDLGECFDELGREWIAAQDVDEAVRCRGGDPEGLRKRMVLYLWSLVEETGLKRNGINKALQYYALEKHAPWVSHLRSESKVRVLAGFARWHWEGCKLTDGAKRALATIHGALADVGFERVTVREIREIVWSIRGKSTHRKCARSPAQRAVTALFAAIEGSETEAPAEREDLARWLDVLLETCPVAADLLGAAFVRLERRNRKVA
jgi:hypothetical protein